MHVSTWHKRLNSIFSRIVHTFGYTTRKKYAFLHSSWEVVEARKTGTTHTALDYVVYRLFYVLILCACGVHALTRYRLLPFLMFFETYIFLLHILYSCVFLSQVLKHNHHRRALGRRQKLPEQLIITDELERDGRKYYVSKKVSILPTQDLNVAEKILWTLFNISTNLTLVSFIVQDSFLGVLIRRDPTHDKEPVLSLYFGMVLTCVDVFSSTVPIKFGHVIYPMIFSEFYTVIDYIYVSYTKDSLYIRRVWSYPVNIEILACIIIVHMILTLSAILRDFTISLLDKSRTQSTQQKLRIQKRMARRKIMQEVRNTDGKLERIVLEHQPYNAEDDVVFWKNNQVFQAGISWDGDSDENESDDIINNSSSSTVIKPNVTKAPPEYRYAQSKPPLLLPEDSTEDTSLSSSTEVPQLPLKASGINVESRWEDHFKDVRLPTPPPIVNVKMESPYFQRPQPKVPEDKMSDADTYNKAPKDPTQFLRINEKPISYLRKNRKRKPKRRFRSPPTPSTDVTRNLGKSIESRRKSSYAEPGEIKEPLIQAMRKEYRSKQLRSTLHKGRPKDLEDQHVGKIATDQLDAELKHERREYTKHHQEHELDRWVYRDQKIKEIDEVSLDTLYAPPQQQSHMVPRHKEKHSGILKKEGTLTETYGRSRVADIVAQKKSNRLNIDPVYDPLGVPVVQNASATFHYLDSKLDRRGEEAKVAIEQVPNYRKHPGIHIQHTLGKVKEGGGAAWGAVAHGGGGPLPRHSSRLSVITSNSGVQPLVNKLRSGVEDVESVVTFHPLIQYFDVPVGGEQQRSTSRRPTAVLLSQILGESNDYRHVTFKDPKKPE